MPPEKAQKRLDDLGQPYKLLSNYKQTMEKALFLCKVCGYEWYVCPSQLLSGYHCPRCSKHGTSLVEQFICACFKQALGDKKVLTETDSWLDVNSTSLSPTCVLPSK